MNEDPAGWCVAFIVLGTAFLAVLKYKDMLPCGWWVVFVLGPIFLGVLLVAGFVLFLVFLYALAKWNLTRMKARDSIEKGRAE